MFPKMTAYIPSDIPENIPKTFFIFAVPHFERHLLSPISSDFTSSWLFYYPELCGSKHETHISRSIKENNGINFFFSLITFVPTDVNEHDSMSYAAAKSSSILNSTRLSWQTSHCWLKFSGKNSNVFPSGQMQYATGFQSSKKAMVDVVDRSNTKAME